MTYKIQLKGFRVKDGKVSRDPRRLNVSLRLKQAASKKIRYRKGMPT